MNNLVNLENETDILDINNLNEDKLNEDKIDKKEQITNIDNPNSNLLIEIETEEVINTDTQEEILIMHPGIINHGNECFMNSALQCLSVSPFIHNYFKKYNDDDTLMIDTINKFKLGKLKAFEMKSTIEKILKDNEDNDDNCDDDGNGNNSKNTNEKITMDEKRILIKMADYNEDIFIYICIKDILNNLYLKKHPIIDCKKFISVAKEITEDTGFSHLFSGEQNDPHEFLAYILDKIHNAKSSKVSIGLPKNYNSLEPYFKLYLEHFKKRYEKDFSMFVRNLYYYMLNVIDCGACHNKTYEVSPNDIICIPLPKNWRNMVEITLYDCLNEMFCIESIDYKCEKCGNTENNRLDKKILNKPQTFIIKIKKYAQIGNNLCKINRMVRYPETININNYVCGNSEDTYRLYAIINHVGVLNTGHYYSYIKEYNEDGKFVDTWFCCNDSQVSSISKEEAFNSNNAYMLFYQIDN